MYTNAMRLSSWTSPRRDRREHYVLCQKSIKSQSGCQNIQKFYADFNSMGKCKKKKHRNNFSPEKPIFQEKNPSP